MRCKKKLAKDISEQSERRFYGRRQGRPLNASRKEVMNALLPKLAIADADLSEDGRLDPRNLFKDGAQEYWFEIGFGAGEHLSGLMQQNQNTAYIGAEPFINGMSAFLKDIQNAEPPIPHDKIRVHMDDAMMVAHSLSDGSLDGIYVLNPDPWHKVRHHKRRIINQDNLDCFARILKPGGQLIMSTDVPYLAEWMVGHTVRHDAFEWGARSSQDWWTPPQGWIHTAYETKKAKGHERQGYFLFKRK